MKKQGWILIAVTGAFFCLLPGVFLGRSTNKSYIKIQDIQTVQTQPTATTEPETLGMIDINTATADQLQLLPGIGESLSQRIVDYRKQHGGFRNIEELMEVSGIGEKKFTSIKDYITVSGTED